jgi:hypothetical protein
MQFRIGHYNGTMNMTVYANDVLISKHDSFDSEMLDLELDVKLPCRLRFVVGNKNSLTDTQVDDTGKITADKFIVLEKLYLGRAQIPWHKLRTICAYTSDSGASYCDTFWAHNGSAVIDFDADSALKWHLRSKIQ